MPVGSAGRQRTASSSVRIQVVVAVGLSPLALDREHCAEAAPGDSGDQAREEPDETAPWVFGNSICARQMGDFKANGSERCEKVAFVDLVLVTLCEARDTCWILARA